MKNNLLIIAGLTITLLCGSCATSTKVGKNDVNVKVYPSGFAGQIMSAHDKESGIKTGSPSMNNDGVSTNISVGGNLSGSKKKKKSVSY